MKLQTSSDLLISHWRFAPKFRTMVQASIDIVQEDVADSLAELERMHHVDTASGVWLDFIGLRVGIERPMLQAPASFERFGYDTGTSTIAEFGIDATGPITIPQGFVIRSEAGYIFTTTTELNWPNASSINFYTLARAEVKGPVPIPADNEPATIVNPQPGVIRAYGLSAGGDTMLGVESEPRSFDQVPFKGELQNRQRYPMSDLLFRRLVKARGVLVASKGDFKSFERAVKFIDPDAEVEDNRDMTVTIASNLQEDMQLADRVGALPRPAGVRIINEQANVFGFKNDLGTTASGEGFDRVRFR